MIEKPPVQSATSSMVFGNGVSHLSEEYRAWQALFAAQPTLVQRFIETQAQPLAEAILQSSRPSTIRFALPDRVVIDLGAEPVVVPPEFREQLAGGLVDRLTLTEGSATVRQRLSELEQSPNQALSMSARLFRHAIVMHLVHNALPSGRTVNYVAAEGEEIPSIPMTSSLEPASALTAPTDAIAEESVDTERPGFPLTPGTPASAPEAEPKGVPDHDGRAGRGELLVPYVPAARRFYLPQWVAFDDEGHLLVKSVSEAEAHVAAMQRFITVLHAAVSLAPYIVADETYQQKRRGMLGQLVNQGRALARYQTSEITQTIQRRAAAHDLNRGLSLSLPYFDDQALQLATRNFEVIPSGRIMFVSAFVVRAARAEQAKVAQDTRLNPSTRKHLLAELEVLAQAFEISERNPLVS